MEHYNLCGTAIDQDFQRCGLNPKEVKDSISHSNANLVRLKSGNNQGSNFFVKVKEEDVVPQNVEVPGEESDDQELIVGLPNSFDCDDSPPKKSVTNPKITIFQVGNEGGLKPYKHFTNEKEIKCQEKSQGSGASSSKVSPKVLDFQTHICYLCDARFVDSEFLKKHFEKR